MLFGNDIYTTTYNQKSDQVKKLIKKNYNGTIWQGRLIQFSYNHKTDEIKRFIPLSMWPPKIMTTNVLLF